MQEVAIPLLLTLGIYAVADRLPLACAGSVSMLSLMDHHCWLAYVLDLFTKLPMLNTFFCIMRTDELFRCAAATSPLACLHALPTGLW